MAKKAKAKKQRKAQQTAAPREGVEGQAADDLGTVSVSVQVECRVTHSSPFDELVIELATLGLSEQPDHVEDRSGNASRLDPDRPIEVDDAGVHLFLKPSVQGAGVYGFNLFCTYDDAVQARMAPPPTEEAPPVEPPPEGGTTRHSSRY